MGAIAIFLATLAINSHPITAASLILLSFVVDANAITTAEGPYLRGPCMLLVSHHIGS